MQQITSFQLQNSQIIDASGGVVSGQQPHEPAAAQVSQILHTGSMAGIPCKSLNLK
jgi:hypothetical protein